jgi:uncharacterized repeat protein (TIGR01451 family)
MAARILASIWLSLIIASGAFASASIQIVNMDGPGEGFNDPAPRTPVGGNPGTTLGEQRLIAFQHAADLWSSVITSDVEIRVESNFDPLRCDEDGATLGSAGALRVATDFDGALFPNTWYHIALANRLAGRDLAPPHADIRASFNSAIDTGCAPGLRWYYGLDNNVPAGQIDLVVVVLHELGHGLGFSTFANHETGRWFENLPDVYASFLYDRTLDLRWPQMSNEERRASAINTGNLVWSGENAIRAAPAFLSAQPILDIHSPASLAGKEDVGTAAFGAPITIAGVHGTVVAALDEANTTGPSTRDACTAITNPGEVAGRIALVDRGDCAFVIKAANVQAAGASGLIIANNADGNPPIMGGNDPSITIPVVSVTRELGTALRDVLGGGVSATIRLDPSQLAGTDPEGRPRMYAPDPLERGSSVSHWDVTAFPDLLMEPRISASLGHGLDLTTALFQDLGWFADASIEASMRHHVLVDHDRDGRVDPGDTVRLIVSIQNTSDTPASDVSFELDPPAGTELVSGSVQTTAGEVLSSAGRVEVMVGDLPPGGEVTIFFDLLIDPLLDPSVSEIAVQGRISGSNFEGIVTDDPSTTEPDDPTIIPIDHTPIRATKSAGLSADLDQDGSVSRGDRLRYTVVIANHGHRTLTGVTFTDTPDPHTVVVPGSVVTNRGTVTRGNAPGDGFVQVAIGSLAPGQSATIVFEVTIDPATPPEVRSIINQGSVSGTNFETIVTDDPATQELHDPTEVFFPNPRRRAVDRR